MSRILNARDGVLSYIDESGQERRIDFTDGLTLDLPPEVKREGHYASPGVSPLTFYGDFEFTPPRDGRGGNARDRRRWRRLQRAAGR